MADERTYTVTLVKVGRGLPYFEVGAWQYTAEWLPEVGDTIAIKRVSAPDGEAPEEAWGFVTRVESDTRDTDLRHGARQRIQDRLTTSSSPRSARGRPLENPPPHEHEWRSAVGEARAPGLHVATRRTRGGRPALRDRLPVPAEHECREVLAFELATACALPELLDVLGLMGRDRDQRLTPVP